MDIQQPATPAESRKAPIVVGSGDWLGHGKMKSLQQIQRTLNVGAAEAMRIQKLMSPKTDRICELYNDENRRAHELLVHARKMEDGLHAAIRELERVDNVKDGHPLVSHNLMYNLRGIVA